MLYNIFLFKGKSFQDLNDLNIYSYPEEIVKIRDTDLISKIIYGHDHGDLVEKYRKSKGAQAKIKNLNNNLRSFVIDAPVPQIINDLNIYTSCINGKIVIGLIFEKDDNPYDYKNVFEELLDELLNNERGCSFEDEIEIENLLITIFIDLRRYGDEYVQKVPEVEFHYQQNFIKIFLFGIDEVGKTSLIRRIKTGEFNDNFFSPTRKFNIDYVQEKRGLLAIWDMPGQRSFRSKWLMGLQDSNLLVFMIDAANQVRFEEAKKEFWKILDRYELRSVPLLILGNKVDLINHISVPDAEQLERVQKEIFKSFDVDKILNREWAFLFTSVKNNYNINSVVDKIFQLIPRKHPTDLLK